MCDSALLPERTLNKLSIRRGNSVGRSGFKIPGLAIMISDPLSSEISPSLAKSTIFSHEWPTSFRCHFVKDIRAIRRELGLRAGTVGVVSHVHCHSTIV